MNLGAVPEQRRSIGRCDTELAEPERQAESDAVSLGLAALALTKRTTSGYGSVSSFVGISIAGVRAGTGHGPSISGTGALAAYTLARTRGPEAAIAAAIRAQTPAQRRAGLGVVVPGSANDRELATDRRRAYLGGGASPVIVRP